MNDVVDRARRRGFCFLYNCPLKTGIEQCAQRRLTKIPGEISLFCAPQNCGAIEFAHARHNHGTAQRSSRQPGEDDYIRLSVEHSRDVVNMDTAPSEIPSVRRFRHVGFGAEQSGSFNYGVFERQVFESVEGVVMNENADWSLSRQETGATIHYLPKLVPSRRHGMAVHRFLLAFDFGCCRATSFSMLTVLLSCE